MIGMIKSTYLAWYMARFEDNEETKLGWKVYIGK